MLSAVNCLKFREYKLKKVIFTVITLLFVFHCDERSQKSRIITGVEEIKNQDGTIYIVATARASERSIVKGNFAMMQATSCAAAKILLKNKIKKKYPSGHFERYTFSDAELLENGKYCRIRIPNAMGPEN